MDDCLQSLRTPGRETTRYEMPLKIQNRVLWGPVPADGEPSVDEEKFERASFKITHSHDDLADFIAGVKSGKNKYGAVRIPSIVRNE